MSTIPDVQTAWVVTAQGKPQDALQLKTDWPVHKELAKGEVLVKIQAGALNPIGWKLMKLLPNFMSKRPYVAEHDFAGVIADANGGEFTNGEEVYGWIPRGIQAKTREGVLAQYARVPADHLVTRPSNITPIQASGLTLAGLTAYQALSDLAKLQPEQTILINGGSTAVGSCAIQIAKAIGCKVVAVASGKNEEYVRKLGADEFIDYTKVTSLHDHLTQNPPPTKFNVIYETVGIFDPSLYTFSEPYLAPNGIFITVGPMPDKYTRKEAWQFLRLLGAICSPSLLSGIKPSWRLVMTKNKPDDMKSLKKLVEEGKVKPLVDSVYEMEDALKAYERILTSRATGKVVVKVDPSVE